MKEKIVLQGIVSRDELEQAYKKRNIKYVYTKIVKQDLQPFFDEGWENTGYRSKKYFRLRKLKEVGPGFEDEVWCIFKRMGFTEMNKDNTFVIPRYKTDVSKQIDIFAKDEQCVCIVECKATKKPHTKKALDKDIDQLAAIKHEIELSIFSHYREPNIRKKIKTIWILATKNIDVSQNDRERAKQARIKIIDDIDYYLELSQQFGKASKYQFLADMLPGIDIPDLLEHIPAIKGMMGDKTFYSFVMEPAQLLKIAYIAHRGKSNAETIETYQRIAKKRRLKKIAEYIHDKKGIFPTNIVINIQSSDKLRFDQAKGMAGKTTVLGTLYIPNKYKTAWIIDGQHRLFAYSDLDEAETATLPVIAFENLETDIHADLFVTINGEQVKVPKGLLVDLWATLHWSSDNPNDRLKALTSRLVKTLKDESDSPFRDRIVSAGERSTKTKNLTLTALADEIRKRQLLGYVASRKAKEITGGPLFVEDLNTTLIRARDVISGYFNNYINNNENLMKQWEIGRGEGGYICTNQGVIPLIRVLKHILDHVEKVDNIEIRELKSSELVEKIWKYQKPVADYLGSANAKVIYEFRRQYGEGGYAASTYEFLSQINKEYNYFDPPGLQKWLHSYDPEKKDQAFKLYTSIELQLMRYVTDRLKNEFGSDISQWWHKAVPDTIKKPTLDRAHADGEYRYPEKYVDFIDWMGIIHRNWDLFGEIFSIDAKPNDSRKKKLHWIFEVNEIRKYIVHPPRSGSITDTHIEYLNKIDMLLKERLAE